VSSRIAPWNAPARSGRHRDDFERAINAEAGGGSAEAYRRVSSSSTAGFSTCSAARHHAIDAEGADFDPNIHQAVTTELAGTAETARSSSTPPRLHDWRRLLRPAMVKVART